VESGFGALTICHACFAPKVEVCRKFAMVRTLDK